MTPFWILKENKLTGSMYVFSLVGVATCFTINRYPRTGWNSQKLGRFFLSYAYSTPAGVAYRLTYGIPNNQSTDNEAGAP